jgi:hypothetical protein
MARSVLLRVVVPAILGTVFGFLALAYAVQNEPAFSPWLLAILSPGLKVAELLTPAPHESLGSTFGGFLRVAIAVNALCYFSLFALAGYVLDRRLSRHEQVTQV